MQGVNLCTHDLYAQKVVYVPAYMQYYYDILVPLRLLCLWTIGYHQLDELIYCTLYGMYLNASTFEYNAIIIQYV